MERYDVHRIAVDFQKLADPVWPLLSGSQAGLPVNWCVWPRSRMLGSTAFIASANLRHSWLKLAASPVRPLALTLFVKACCCRWTKT